ncbi:MAG: glycoside hydrolase family 3 N-terminal domain-containing protein [Elusimicrobia bacterium]|nr:glycoside hydrolase family 3 N-terminal domain-containing protein [Elusimicrobiota bacterium]
MRRAAFGFAILTGLVGTPPLRSQPEASRLPYRDVRLPVEQRVADLLSRMTLEEKVAQTRGIWLQKALIKDEKGSFSEAKARVALKFGIGEVGRPSEIEGSLGETREAADEAVHVNDIQRFLLEKTRLGIPTIIHEEALHGLAARGATSFPSAIALAGTWDVNLIESVFQAVAQETRARGVAQVLTPVLDVARDPRWGRTEETYGEDPYLVSRIGAACIRGLQGSGPAPDKNHVIATAKHFAVHGQPEAGINAGPGNYSERIIREVFLPPFKAAVTEAGVMSVMASYNEIDRILGHANKWLLNRILREEWGFHGFVVSDYGGIQRLAAIHHVAADSAQAAKRALEAGVDVELPVDNDWPNAINYDTLVQQVREKRIDEETLDKAVARVLRAKFLLGLFEDPYGDPALAGKASNSPQHRSLALQAAREALVLLKNKDRTLPLDRSRLKSVAVIGPNAAICHLGGYSDDPGRLVSVLDGIRAKAGKELRVDYALGCKISKRDEGFRSWYRNDIEPADPAENVKLIAQAARVAGENDAVVLVLGGNENTAREAWFNTWETRDYDHPGDRDNLDLPGQQDELVRAVLATGKPTVVVLINGSPLSANYVAEHVPAIIEGWYLGQETGHAVADVLFGDYNPAGRLPITFPRTAGQLPAYYNYKPSAKRGYLFADQTPLFPFGHGLSYTTFRYERLKVTPEKIGPAGKAVVSVDVTNTGDRTGEEVVQLYIRDEVSSVTRPVKELKGFRRVQLNPGQTAKVEFPVGFEELAFYNEDMKLVVEPGAFTVMVGPNSVDLKTAGLEVAAP